MIVEPDDLMRPVKLGTQAIGAAGELLARYQLLQLGIDSARLTTDSGIDLVMYLPGQELAATIQVKTKWKPVPAMFTCLLFGFLDALQIRLQNAEILGVTVPVQAIQALPYVLTCVLLAGFIGKAVGPKAGGVPYVKER